MLSGRGGKSHNLEISSLPCGSPTFVPWSVIQHLPCRQPPHYHQHILHYFGHLFNSIVSYLSPSSSLTPALPLTHLALFWASLRYHISLRIPPSTVIPPSPILQDTRQCCVTRHMSPAPLCVCISPWRSHDHRRAKTSPITGATFLNWCLYCFPIPIVSAFATCMSPFLIFLSFLQDNIDLCAQKLSWDFWLPANIYHFEIPDTWFLFPFLLSRPSSFY